ncbi:hypothetical protein [Streptomyces flavofungini]|uniref:Uncharacterized protein n=1 Tax=Streptomyces flavofungini TaxID=68200 RepID=A0ABS0XGM0_9ACTN|nr:hypothetical protein [Streptomyces flavofungini]MBJ3812330.1 hypothetical protein [Streptomyces flavofungini]GHC88402.1 hypothetical protein GCM10010349_75660 [Streptomyces flavofungini]
MDTLPAHQVVLAGKLADLGDSWIGTALDWGTKGLQAGLVVIVVVVMVQRLSLKAGIGALILMVIALGLYSSRYDLADIFKDEVENPAQSAPAVEGSSTRQDPVRAGQFGGRT